MRLRGLIIAGLAVLVVSLLAHVPASVVVGWSGLHEQLAMEGVRGTVWTGDAAAASLALGPGEARTLYLGRVRWRWRPLSLLRGRLDYQVETAGPTLNARGVVGVSPGGRIHVAGTRARARMATLLPLLPMASAAGLDGILDLDVERLVLAPAAHGSGGDGAAPAAGPTLWPRRADARVQVRGVEVALLAGTPLGDYELAISDDEASDDLLVSYRDLGGPLELAGTARVRPDGSFERECTARARPDAPLRLAQAAPFICDPNMF